MGDYLYDYIFIQEFPHPSSVKFNFEENFIKLLYRIFFRSLQCIIRTIESILLTFFHMKINGEMLKKSIIMYIISYN